MTQFEDIQALVYTAWFRKKTKQLLILTDYSCRIVEEYTESGIPCGHELITDIVLTPVAVQHRSNSVEVDFKTFTKNVESGAIVRIIAPDNVFQMAAQIEQHLKNK